MATSSNVQYLSAGPADIAASNRRVTETFYAGAAIVIGDCVAMSTEATGGGADRVVTVVKAQSNAATARQACGILIAHDGASATTAAAGDRCTVVVKGYCEGANLEGAVVKGDILVSSTVAGQAAKFAGTEVVAPFAMALEDDTANVGDVWVFGLFS